MTSLTSLKEQVLSIRIVRKETGPKGTFGELWIDGKKLCETLEPPYRDKFSCIPAGKWYAFQFESKKYGKTWNIRVPGRVGILFHCGNFHEHSKGCVLLGLKRVGNHIENSRPAMSLFRVATASYKMLEVEVVEEWPPKAPEMKQERSEAKLAA